MQIQFLLRLINCSSKVKLPLKNRTEITLRRKGGGKGAIALVLLVLLMSQDVWCVCVWCVWAIPLLFFLSKLYVQKNNNFCQKGDYGGGLLSTATAITTTHHVRLSYTYHKTVLFDLSIFKLVKPFKSFKCGFSCFLFHLILSLLFCTFFSWSV